MTGKRPGEQFVRTALYELSVNSNRLRKISQKQRSNVLKAIYGLPRNDGDIDESAGDPEKYTNWRRLQERIRRLEIELSTAYEYSESEGQIAPSSGGEPRLHQGYRFNR